MKAAKDDMNEGSLPKDDAKFQPGDTVRLKSGGPHMTVFRVTEGWLVDCVWFQTSESAAPVQAQFTRACLQAAIRSSS